MPRILIAEMKQETSTFNPSRTRYNDFQILRGGDILAELRGTKTEIAGALDVFESRAAADATDSDVEIVPTLAAWAVSGGPIDTADLDRLLDELVTSVKQNSDVDAAYLCLHGAMAGEDEGDPEGRAVAEIREVLGDVPIVVSLDLHAVLTDRLIEAADIVVPYHTYPHIDHYETGQRAARNVMRLLDGSAKPTVAHVKLPMLVRGDELITATGRFGEAIRMCQQLEASDKGLAAGVIIGNAFTDVPALQSNVIVTTNDDPQLAQQQAEKIARFMWENRRLFVASLTSLDESIRLANQTEGLTIFSDAADATASGASGDSNAILKGLLDSRDSRKALVQIVDAPAVAAALAAGVGATIDVDLGGTVDPGRFTPVRVSASVRSLHDGNFVYENGTAALSGRIAVLAIGAIHVLVSERSIFVVGRKVFLAHGLDPIEFDLVVVKSPNGFRTYYESIAARIVSVDVPGSTSANLKSLPFENCVRPIFPLDEDAVPPFLVGF